MSAFLVLLHYIPAALRAERGPLTVEQLPARLDAGPINAGQLRQAIMVLKQHGVVQRVPVTPLIRAELISQGVKRPPCHAIALTGSPRTQEFTAWLDSVHAPRSRVGVSLRRSA